MTCKRLLILISFSLSLGGFLLYPNPSSALEPPVETALRLQDHFSEISSLSFSFSQSTSGSMTGRPKKGQGNGLFVKTAGKTLMRWNYNAPERQVVISDGETVTMYFEKLNQLIITPVDSARTDVLFSFFTGSRPIREHFSILPPEPELAAATEGREENLQIIQLQPKDSDSQVRTIHLWITDSSLIRRIELLDFFDTRTIINLSRITINPLVDVGEPELTELFSFTPPAGTEIIRN